MAQFFTSGDLREAALPRWWIDEDGNVLGSEARPIHVSGSVVLESDAGDVEEVYANLRGYRSADGTYQPLRLDRYTNTVQTIDYAHHEIHAGSHFFVTDYQTIGNGSSVDWMLTTPNTAKWAHLTFEVQGTAVTTAVFYEGANRTGTTPLTVFNNDRNSGALSGLLAHRGVSGGTTDGTPFWQMSGGTASAQFRGGPDVRQDTEIILKQNTKYVLKVTSGTAGNVVSVRLRWYEHTNL
jgi:hypothetical protein